MHIEIQKTQKDKIPEKKAAENAKAKKQVKKEESMEKLSIEDADEDMNETEDNLFENMSSSSNYTPSSNKKKKN